MRVVSCGDTAKEEKKGLEMRPFGPLYLWPPCIRVNHSLGSQTRDTKARRIVPSFPISNQSPQDARAAIDSELVGTNLMGLGTDTKSRSTTVGL